LKDEDSVVIAKMDASAEHVPELYQITE